MQCNTSEENWSKKMEICVKSNIMNMEQVYLYGTFEKCRFSHL